MGAAFDEPMLRSSSANTSKNAVGYVACAAVALGTYAFLLLMTHYEPITGDGWILLTDMKKGGSDFAALFKRMRSYHNSSNPRIGQLFTMLSYGPVFHSAVTPIVLSLWPVLAVVHGTGKWPSLGSFKSAALFVFAFAAAWMCVPKLGDAFFYRPILTNYTYSVVIALAFFLPMRLDTRVRSAPKAVAMAVVMLALGMPVGMLNEHVGPMMIVLGALATALALRKSRKLDVLWRGSATVGIVLGYLFLYFAPGQTRRYGGMGKKSPLDTVLDRGLYGNVQELSAFARHIAPLLCFMAVLLALYVATASTRARDADGNDGPSSLSWSAYWSSLTSRSELWPLLYTLAAAGIFVVSLAAPKNNYRMYIAPACLVAIVAIWAFDRMWHDRVVRAVGVAGSLLVHVVFCGFMLSSFSEIHAAETERLAIVKQAGPGGHAKVPPLPHSKRRTIFFGDSLGRDPRNLKRMAFAYGLKSVTVIKGATPSKGKR